MERFSVILPVRNGGEYIKLSVASILQQDVNDFNLIILENKSTDGTGEWLKQLDDPRIIIHPSNDSLSIDQNWGRIKDVDKNEFMTIIGHDDLLASNYLSVMDKLIQQYPDASLYQTHFNFIDDIGNEKGKCQSMPAIQSPQDVIKNFLCEKMDIMGTGFMMRSRDFDELGGMPDYDNLLFADMELWINLSVMGFLATAKEECFSYRKHAGATTATSSDLKVLNAFDRFVAYLEKMGDNNSDLKTTIANSADCLLNKYVQGISHRVMRTPNKKRDTPGVREIVTRFREYGNRLKGDNSFEPLHNSSVRLAELIDQNFLLQKAFLLFKKIYRKPIL